MKKSYSVLACACGVVLWGLSVACGQRAEQAAQQPADTHAADEAAIRANSQEWSKAAGAKDLEKCMSFYADDAQRLGSGAPVAVGIEAIRKQWTEYLALPGHGFRWTTSKIEVARSRDFAYETGAYELQTTDKKKQPVTVKGKYLVVWKKQTNGNWKAVADTDNTDQ